jgi:hypothetical protein
VNNHTPFDPGCFTLLRFLSSSFHHNAEAYEVAGVGVLLCPDQVRFPANPSEIVRMESAQRDTAFAVNDPCRQSLLRVYILTC